jgi:transcriptional regulator with XRE-family HTH domain
MAISEKIRNARVKLKLSQEEVCEKLSISRQTLSNWENDKYLPDILSVIKMSQIYNMSLDELLKDEKEIINKLEKDTQLLKKYKTLSIVASLVLLLGSIIAIIFKFLDIDTSNIAINIVLALFVILSTILFGIAVCIYNKKENKEED